MGTKSKVTPSFTKTVSHYKSIAIDSMCFIYQFEDNETYAILMQALFSRLQENKLSAVTSVLTLSEILAFERVQKDIVLFEKTKNKLTTTPNLTILPVDEQIAQASAILKQTYKLTLPDAIQLATALITNQKAYITNDDRFKKCKEIKILLLDEFLKK